MIKIIDGDLLDSNADIICHQVNCQGKMNSGIAKQIRTRYPKVYESYEALCGYAPDKKKLLGMCQMLRIDNDKYVANLFGQLFYGYDGNKYTDLDALKRAMISLRNRISRDKTIAFPYGLASVRGGADWEEVYKTIENIFAGYNVEIWRLDKG